MITEAQGADANFHSSKEQMQIGQTKENGLLWGPQKYQTVLWDVYGDK